MSSKKLYMGLATIAGLITAGSSYQEVSSFTSSFSAANSTASLVISRAAAADPKFDDRQVVKDFADRVVIPTQQLFVKRSEELASAVNTFVKNPNEQTLKAARSAWVAARSPWEQSEGFTFGPADSLGYDAALDSWPVNETDLKAVLQSQDQFTPEYVKNLKDTEKGFHVIEYLLFGENNNKKVADFNQREFAYLQALSTDFNRVAQDLLTSWTQGVEGQPAYRQVVATAGESGNSTYPSLQAGAQEIVQGMIDSLDEVANEKIGEPFEKKDEKLMESRFSNNTLNDLKSNVKGAQNVYLGRFPDGNTNGKGLSAYIAQLDPSVDRQVKNQMQTALAALNQIPAPIETAIANPQAADEIQAAQQAINTLQATIKTEVLPLVSSASGAS